MKFETEMTEVEYNAFSPAHKLAYNYYVRMGKPANYRTLEGRKKWAEQFETLRPGTQHGAAGRSHRVCLDGSR